VPKVRCLVTGNGSIMLTAAMKRSWTTFALIIGLAALLGTLGVVQYRSLTRASAADGEKAKRLVKERADHFAADFNREIQNAYFNFQKLGVVVRRYYPNLYGETSGMQGGLPTDRIVAEWWLDRTRAPIAGTVRRLKIHPDIQMLKKLDIHSARALQQRVAQEFQKNLDDRFHAAGFVQNAETSEYVFVQGAASAHSPG